MVYHSKRTIPEVNAAYVERTGLSEAILSALVCFMAAEACGKALVTVRQAQERCEFDCHHAVSKLAKLGFLESPDRVTNSRERLWKPTAKAWRTYGFIGWRVWTFSKNALQGGAAQRCLLDTRYREFLQAKANEEHGYIDVTGKEDLLEELAAS